jgi:hypothetical protein
MHKNVQKALQERRLKFFSNGKYSYQPSQEYLAKFKGEKAVKSDPYLPTLKEAANKLWRIEKAFEVAERRGKRVSHVAGGKIQLAG